MQPDPLIGTNLANRYKVSRLLHEGRTGRIYLANDSAEKRRVALKILNPLLCSVEAQVRRFEREFEVTSQIDHPNCVKMFEFGEADGHRYLVMEYLDGKGLDTFIGDGKKMSPREAARIALQIASALAAAYSKDVIHRDVNPSNVMLCKVGRQRDVVKMLDFGLARLQGSSEELTGVGERLGTAHYMAPEYIQDTGLDNRSDLYGLGCMLFEMLTGRTPFVGPPLRVLESHVKQEAPAPTSISPGTPPCLDALVLKLLEKVPDARPRDAQEVVDVLTQGLPMLEADLDRERAAQSDAAPSQARQAPIVPSGMGRSTALFDSAKYEKHALETQPIFVPQKNRQSVAQPKWLWVMVLLTLTLVLSSLFGTFLTWWFIPG